MGSRVLSLGSWFGLRLELSGSGGLGFSVSVSDQDWVSWRY